MIEKKIVKSALGIFMDSENGNIRKLLVPIFDQMRGRKFFLFFFILFSSSFLFAENLVLATDSSLKETMIDQGKDPSPSIKKYEKTSRKDNITPVKKVFPCKCSVRLRQIEPRGIGYSHGYSSIDGLFFFDDKNPFWPFLDLRFHYFDNSRPAANAGLGFRKALNQERICGFNLYYDYRYTSCDRHFHQIGLGFEYLSPSVDLRLNGYLPIKQEMTCGCDCFFTYPGNYYYGCSEKVAALKGANLELGRIFSETKNSLIYGAVDGYYYGGDVCRKGFGGKGRVNLSFTPYFSLELSVSYDEIYKMRAQGEIFFNFPFCLSSDNKLRNSLSQPIERHEIISLEKYCKWRWNY